MLLSVFQQELENQGLQAKQLNKGCQLELQIVPELSSGRVNSSRSHGCQAPPSMPKKLCGHIISPPVSKLSRSQHKPPLHELQGPSVIRSPLFNNWAHMSQVPRQQRQLHLNLWLAHVQGWAGASLAVAMVLYLCGAVACTPMPVSQTVLTIAAHDELCLQGSCCFALAIHEGIRAQVKAEMMWNDMCTVRQPGCASVRCIELEHEGYRHPVEKSALACSIQQSSKLDPSAALCWL